ncbi:MAG: ABC transporter substrate-binding protein [Candidatus Dormibacteraeota bacterium]|nr:ABC transporter substrate-binding protein [Candidatus Dormibacteraeota bacterium]
MRFVKPWALVGAGLLAASACGGGSTATTGPTASDVGVTKDTITLGGTIALSGPAAAYGTIARASDAYFHYVNDNGGVNGRKINYKFLDDGYNPAQTVPLTRQLVEQDQVFALFGGLGTQPQESVREYLNTKKVPQAFVATGATTFSAEHQKFPYTFGWQPVYQGESLIYANYILKNMPNAKIGVIYQNDDFGQDYLAGLKKGLGSKASSMILDSQPNDAASKDLSSQLIKLKASGADTLFVFETPGPAIISLVTAYKLGWRPAIFLNSVAAPVPYVGAAAKAAQSPQAVEGLYSVEYALDPVSASSGGSAGGTLFKNVMTKYYPAGNLNDAFNMYGMAVAYSMVDALKHAGSNPTRKNLLQTLNNLNESNNPFLMPGVRVKNSPNDHYTITQEFLARYANGTYTPQGGLVDVKGKITFP